MQITVSGHHLTLTPAISNAVEAKFNKLAHHYPEIDKLTVTLKLDGKNQVAEVNLNFLGAAITCQAAEKDLYKAIALSAKKLDAALAHHKGHINKDLRNKPSPEVMAEIE